jgi:GalNAc-alpha-(1->4)-GalNAc-alpha-(1->3)-diNAcBac-PP-undecaprenol alpha-1,4-N-acetyl-D-galactosaminyltransferase
MSKENKKILFLINSLGVGGAEKVFVNDANSLKQKGYDVYFAVLYRGKSNTKITLLQVEADHVWHIGFKNLYDIRSYVNLVHRIKKDKIELVYSTLDEANFVAKICRVFASFKLFCREANMTFDKPLKFKIADILLNSLVYKLVMVAEAVRDSYSSYDPLRKRKMTVLYNGVSIDGKPSRQATKPLRVLAVGSFTPKKGFMDLIEIFKDYVIPKKDGFTIEIIGNGVLLEEVRAKVNEWGLENIIICPGGMDPETLKIKYQEAHIFVLTSRKEGCPNVLLEAMSYGLAPVCYSVGAVPEIINNGISGIVVSLGGKEKFGREVVSLMESADKIESIGTQARLEIEKKFSESIHVDNLIKTLEL